MRVICFEPPQSRNERLDTVFDVLRQKTYTRDMEAWPYLGGLDRRAM